MTLLLVASAEVLCNAPEREEEEEKVENIMYH